MQLGWFVKEVVNQLVNATEESSRLLERKVEIANTDRGLVIKFDVALTVENVAKDVAGAGLRVIDIDLFNLNTGKGSETKNASISRVEFGICVVPKK